MRATTTSAPWHAVLFDSGGTLVRPAAGSWMPGAHFEAFAAEHGFDRTTDRPLWTSALHAGNAVLAAEPVVPTVDDEVVLFTEYFTMLSRYLGLPGDAPSMRGLAQETVFGKGHEESYEDVPEVLAGLRAAGYPLLLLANGWPSLSRRYQELGLRDHFAFFSTSTQLGIKKPNRRVFRLVSEITNIEPSRLLVVDDLAANIFSAADLGMPGILVKDSTSPVTPGMDRIDSIAALPGWMERTARNG